MNRFLILSSLVLLLLGSCGPNTGKDQKTDEDSTSMKGSFKIIGSQTLYPMMVKWASIYIQQNKEVNISVRGTYSDPSIRMLLEGVSDIAMISRPLTDEEIAKGLVAYPVAMDAVIPVISFENKHIQKLVMKGVSKETLAGIFSGKIRDWSEVSGKTEKEEIKVYVHNDSSGTAETWNKFLGLETSSVAGTPVISEIELLNFIKRNPGSIGYTSMVSAYNLKTGFRKEGIYILPIDFNSNKNIEDNEQFYDKITMLGEAVYSGKMPSPPARELYIVTRGKPTQPLVKEFIKWVLTIGQNYMTDMGYLHITQQKANANLENLK